MSGFQPPGALPAYRLTSANFERAVDPGCACPGCGRRGMASFYGLDSIPVHSCMLVADPQQAASFPRSSLSLAYCEGCGFISNTRYEPSLQNYALDYEETQGFSPTFSAFAEDLARDLVARCNLHNRSILEIGCGKGEFLVLLSRIGNNSGIGIDPAYVPGRLPDEMTARLTFIRDFYSQAYAHLDADFICCRHTLEHIATTREFVRTIRTAIGDNPDVLVFFEVPDVLRILREGAFWDIYYEHCSYFSAGSLARLFRSLSFDVIDLRPAYDDQYILLTARPADAPTQPRLELENDLQALYQAVQQFPDVCRRQIDRWGSVLDAGGGCSPPVVWGSGSKGVAFLTTLQGGSSVRYVVDINPHRHGKFMPATAQPIVAPEFLAGRKPGCVIAMNPIYRDEIRRELDRLGVAAPLFAV